MIKELIQHIADEDLELNLTIQVGSDRAETLEQELREIKNLLLRQEASADITEEEKEKLQKSISENGDSLQKKQDLDYTGFDSEDAEISEDAERALDEVKEDFEEDVEENFGDSEDSEGEENGDSNVPEPSQEKPGDKKKREAEEDFQEVFGLDDGDEDEFEEVFGEDEDKQEPEPTDPPEDEPTEEERSEAGADFQELFG